MCAAPSSTIHFEGEKNNSDLEILVIDASTEEPIPAAQVKIMKKDLVAYTDFEGLASIKQIEKGSYDIEITFVSYQKKQLKAFEISKSYTRVVVKLLS